MIMLDTKTVARNTRDPTMKATREKKTVPLKVPKTTNPSPAAPDLTDWIDGGIKF